MNAGSHILEFASDFFDNGFGRFDQTSRTMNDYIQPRRLEFRNHLMKSYFIVWPDGNVATREIFAG